jgi:hypothetical protein
MKTATCFAFFFVKSSSTCDPKMFLYTTDVISEYEGGRKYNRYYFFKWSIMFYTITILVSFKVLSFWFDTLVQTFFPLLKTFLELFSAVQVLQRFHFSDINKTFPFRLSYTWVLLKVSFLKSSCSIKTVSAVHFPNRKQNFTHNLCSLLSAIMKIAELPNRHLE